MSQILFIDTSNSDQVKVGLGKGENVEYLTSERKNLKSQAVIPLIDKLLKTKEIKPEDLTEIRVVDNSGSFTGLRVGAAIANAFGFLLKISVNGKKIGELVEPTYKK